MTDLPHMLTKQQAQAFLQVKADALQRMLDDGTVPSVKLGTAKSAPVRIPRDKMLESLGLISRGDDRRRRRAAAAERYAALGMVGGAR